jgi:hypothetical protein
MEAIALMQQGQSSQCNVGNATSATRAMMPAQHRQQRGLAGVMEGNFAYFAVGGKFAKEFDFAKEGNFAEDGAFAKEVNSAKDGNFA